jgi:RNA polymerase sigma factor (sigma-70 family)
MTTRDAKRRISDWFMLWRSPLRRFLQGRSGVSAADADDVAQEVFLRLMRYDTAELIEHPQAYIYKVASNVAAEWAVRARNQRPHEAKWLAALVDQRLPESPLLLSQLQDEVERGLSTLSPQQRDVLMLHFTESLSYAEIAHRRGESLRSVRRQFIKSYEKLRVELDPDLLGEIPHGSD